MAEDYKIKRVVGAKNRMAWGREFAAEHGLGQGAEVVLQPLGLGRILIEVVKPVKPMIG